MLMNESKEMYLETILILHEKSNFVRAIDIAMEMRFSKPSVSKAIHNLEKDDYIIIEDSGNIKLTKKGLEIAKEIYERHVVLTNALIKLGVSPDIASSDACKIEHHISKETFKAIKKHMS